MVIGQDDVGCGPGRELAQRLRPEQACNPRVVGHRHLHNLVGAHHPRVAARLLVRKIDGLHFCKHVVAKAVVPQSETDAALQQFERTLRTNRVVHVRARLVRHVRARVAQYVHLVVVNMDTVRGNGPCTEHLCAVEALYNPCSKFAQAVCLVSHIFGHVHVKTAAGPLRGIDTAFQRTSRERKRRVQAEGGAQQRMRHRVLGANKALILGDAGERPFGPVAIRNLIGARHAHTGLLCTIGDHIQRALNRIGAGVMVDQARRAVADCVHQRRQCRVANVLQVKRLVQPPPQFLQDFDKVPRRLSAERHAARERPIKVGVAANIARQHQLPARVQYFIVREGCH